MRNRGGARRLGLLLGVGALLSAIEPVGVLAQAPPSAAVVAAPAGTPFAEADARRWLTQLSSDLFQGRETFTEGYGLASAYVAGELRALGVEPLGDEGTYFQAVVRRGYRVTQRSKVTVTARGETRTFTHGEHVSFAANAGGRQTLTLQGAELVGYGLAAVTGTADVVPTPKPGALVLFLPGAPQALTGGGSRVPRGLLSTQARATALTAGPTGARAAIGLSLTPIGSSPSAGGASETPAPASGRGGRGGSAGQRDLVSTLAVDRVVPPALVADETFFDFVLGDSGGGIRALRAQAERGEALPALSVGEVTLTIDIDTAYQVVSTERTQNIVAVVRGTDPVLRDQFVMFGAHLDHVGYADGTQSPGRTNVPLDQDGIWNGADDDGSGVTALLALAKAFNQGPRPRRSVVFVWHAGEESGLVGSLHMAENPVVPLADVQALFNIDMIGRNRDNDDGQANTVFLIGADRISTDLHNLIVEANDRMASPMKLDYEYNDVADSNSFYTRSDHYSYATKGVPAAFFFTGTHPDYHANTDTVDKILFPKLLRVTELAYRAALLVANRDDRLVRDNRGPRSGRGFSGRLGP